MKTVSITVLSYLLLFLIVNHTIASQDAKTKLLVTVIDDRGNNVEGASIIIYSSIEDYENSQNILIKGETDKKGRFQFKGLESKPYFLEVKKDNKKNDGQGIQTGLLSEGKINKVMVVIR